jgi:hypothetical protein
VPCNQCGKILKTIATLQQHEKYVHASVKSSVSCNQCGKILKTTATLQQHKKNIHSVPNQSVPTNRCHECSMEDLPRHVCTKIFDILSLKLNTNAKKIAWYLQNFGETEGHAEKIKMYSELSHKKKKFPRLF